MDLNTFYKQLLEANQKRGYFLNPDQNFTKSLLEGLLTNEKRYGYQSCPCRLASGNKEEDLDIICPCDYRDPDLTQYGNCFCGLYVSREILEGKKSIASIPERRPIEAPRAKARGIFRSNSFNPSDLSAVALAKAEAENLSIHSRLESRGFLRRRNKNERKKMKEKSSEKTSKFPYPVWRCKVCGYLCARKEPPEVCPICGAEKERFEKFA